MTDPFNGPFSALELRRIQKDIRDPLSDFFVALQDDRDNVFFHPHPLTREQATKIANYVGHDLYYALTFDTSIVAYGLLRGWDEGFETPSLGIAVARKWRGAGVGNTMMNMLHLAARFRGAKKIRLKVHVMNHAAIDLYKSLGYEFLDKEGEQLVGFLAL